MKVVLDTNVLVSGIFWGGPSADILDLWVDGQIEVVVSPPILQEYERLLEKMEHKKPLDLAEAWRGFITRYSVLVYPEGTFRLCRDPHDDKFLHCAVSAGAKFLISGDKDLLVLKRVAEVDILSPGVFLRLFHRKS